MIYPLANVDITMEKLGKLTNFLWPFSFTREQLKKKNRRAPMSLTDSQIPYIFLVGGFNPSVKIKIVSWDYYSQYMEKTHVPNHQPDLVWKHLFDYLLPQLAGESWEVVPFVKLFQVLCPLPHTHSIPPLPVLWVAVGRRLHMLYGENIIAGSSKNVVQRCYMVVYMQ